MGILTNNEGKPKATKTGTGDENEEMEDAESRDSVNKGKELDDQEDDKDMERAGADLAMRMAEASEELADTLEEGTYTTPLVDPLTNDEDGKQYNDSNSTVKPRDDNLSMSEYNSDILEVSSSKFEAAHGQKYKEPANFLQPLWNKASPSVGSMKIMMEMMRTEFKGELAGLQADLTNYSQRLVNFLIKEAGKDSTDGIVFLDQITDQLNKYDKEDNEGEDSNKELDALPPNKEVESVEASKTQGMLPGAPEENPGGETTATAATMAEGDKEGTQSISMAAGG
jgi:hypothetical protein